jgi:hypothetical protein
MQSGDAKKVTQLVSDLLLSKTQYNYNRTAMSEYGRSMGGLFSMFSKWPTSVGADIYYGFNRKNMPPMASPKMRTLVKYLGPIIALALVDQFAYKEVADKSPRTQKLVGKRLYKWSPLTAPFTVSMPPVIEMTSNAIKKGVSAGDAAEAARSAGRDAVAMVPGMVWTKFMYETMPQIITDQKQRPWQEQVYQDIRKFQKKGYK